MAETRQELQPSVNFFAPASVYASNPENGSAVEEFAGLVHAFHQAGLAVVLDVVYNHVGIPPHLIHIDREIYCSTDEDENLTNFSGCGNDLRCDSEPVKKSRSAVAEYRSAQCAWVDLSRFRAGHAERRKLDLSACASSASVPETGCGHHSRR